jgi:20S proteasome subunit beta 1
MTREEAEAFVTEALALAMARDASSGGVIRTVTLDKDGAKLRWVPMLLLILCKIAQC